MIILTISLVLFMSLRLATAADAVNAALTTAPAQWSVSEAWVGYTFTAGSCECLGDVIVFGPSG